MIKTAISALAIAGLAAASPAFAATAPVSDTGTVNITGTVGKKCQFTGTDPETLNLGELAGIDGKLDTAKVDNKTKNLTAWCNAASKVSVTANPIKAQVITAPSTSFDDRIEYKATATIGATSADDTTDAGTLQLAGLDQNVGIFSSTVVVTLSNSSTTNSGLLVADDYAGSVTVTLTPQ
jgi:hypothetical protein